MKMSVVIPTYNRAERLGRVLRGLERQTYPLNAFEVIVISDGSTDGTDAMLRNLATPLMVTPVRQDNSGPSTARNAGITRAIGDLVLFLDDDVVPQPQLVAEHLRAHAELGPDVVVMGPMLTPPDMALAPWVRWEQAMLYKQYGDMLAGRWQPTARQFYTGNTSLARAHLTATGGFDTSLRRAEDVELAYRLAARGLGFVFRAGAAGYHYAERSFRSWQNIPYSYGRSDVLFARDRAQEWLIPTIMYELRGRSAAVRRLSLAMLDRPLLSAAAQLGLRTLADLAGRARQPRVAQAAYSGIFNMRYYQGMADELGGRAAFLALAAVDAPPPTVPGALSARGGTQ